MIVVEGFKVNSTPNATMTTFAAPSLGSVELSAWRVTMEAGANGPEHVITREQVWLPLTGSMTVTTPDESTVVSPGQSVILPSGTVRQISAPSGPVEALVCMPAGGHAEVAGDPREVPWAQ